MNLIKRYEEHLDKRVKKGELKENTRSNYENGMSYILEALVGQIPVNVVQCYCEEWGAEKGYENVIRQLAKMAKDRKRE